MQTALEVDMCSHHCWDKGDNCTWNRSHISDPMFMYHIHMQKMGQHKILNLTLKPCLYNASDA